LQYSFLQKWFRALRSRAQQTITMCNMFGRKYCQETVHIQVSLEERTMIHTQLKLGLALKVFEKPFGPPAMRTAFAEKDLYVIRGCSRSAHE